MRIKAYFFKWNVGSNLILSNSNWPLIVAGNKILELFRPVKIVYIKEQGSANLILPDRFLELERVIKILFFLDGYFHQAKNSRRERAKFLNEKSKKSMLKGAEDQM